MKLVVSRSQQDMKGMFGGHKGVNFTLHYRLQLTDEEAEMVRRYKLEEYVVTDGEVRGGEAIPPTTIRSLIGGQTSTVTNVTRLLRKENEVKEGCDALVILFDVCRSFGGQEVIEYPRKKE